MPIFTLHLQTEYSRPHGRKVKELSEGALDVLMRHPWPGNVRELKNLVERLVIICPQQRIEAHHRPPELFRAAARGPQQPSATLHEARAAYEREFIHRQLEEHQWNSTHTAQAVGLEPSHHYRILKP